MNENDVKRLDDFAKAHDDLVDRVETLEKQIEFLTDRLDDLVDQVETIEDEVK